MKNDNIKIVAIIAAAGQGKRLGLGYNKNFMCLFGQPVLMHCINTLRKCSNIIEIIVVVGENEIFYTHKMLNNNFETLKCSIIAGGSERQYSIANAIKKIKSNAEIILIHDGARPLVSRNIIKKVSLAAFRYKAATAAVIVKDTIKIVNDKGFVSCTPDRKMLWAVQTPQAFQANIIKDAYDSAERNGYLSTDDTSLVERIGIKAKIVNSVYSNIKITTPEDIVIIDAMAKMGVKQK